MTLFADLLATVFDRRYRAGDPSSRDMRQIEALTADLMSATGEISGAATARQILDRYLAWSDEEKLQFFNHLAHDLGISEDKVRETLETYAQGQTKSSYRAFMMAAEAPRQELIRRLNQVPGATRLLVNMRADLLKLGRNDDALQALDVDFRHLFVSWFNRGFLVLRPISWESPAHILEKIIAYEAVHAIDSWDDLRRRLEPEDRRCFAFFHPAMPDEPLIFVEVALTKGIPDSIGSLLAEGREAIGAETANTAVFYSISNCQSGLANISFGNSLIKQVAADLAMDLPGLKTFVTLSPLPGFSNWLADEGYEHSDDDDDKLRQQAARYLLTAKRGDGLPLDPVARFHLGNGARVHDVHAGADLSEKGQEQSFGVMVNYLYDLKRVSQNHEKFASSQDVVASKMMRALSKAAKIIRTQEGS